MNSNKARLSYGSIPLVSSAQDLTFATRTIRDHNIASQVQIILPTSAVSSLDLTTLKSSTPVNYQLSCPLAILMANSKLWALVCSGEVTILSQTQLDHQNVIAVVGGFLHLSLLKDIYEQCGLLGEPITWDVKHINDSGARSQQRYKVKIDLKKITAMESKRLAYAVSEGGLKSSFEFVISMSQIIWKTLNETLATGSLSQIELEMYTLENTKIISLDVPTKKSLQNELTIGPISDELYSECFQEWALSVDEWAQLMTMDSDRVKANDSIDSYLSTFKIDSDTVGQLTHLRWTGVTSSKFPLAIWKQLLNPNVPWAVLITHGIEDSPVSWKHHQHGFFTSGENAYTVVKLNNQVTESTVGSFLCSEVIGILDQHF